MALNSLGKVELANGSGGGGVAMGVLMVTSPKVEDF